MSFIQSTGNRRIKTGLNWLLLLLLLTLPACNSATPFPTATLPPASATTDQATQTAPTSAPTETSAPRMVLLIAPDGSDSGSALAIQGLLRELSASEAFLFETRMGFDQLDLPASIRVVVSLPPDAGVANAAAANPQTQFLAIGIDGLQTSPNLSLIGEETTTADKQGFLAGFLASVITSDWRVGVISLADEAASKAARLGFKNGAVYFCGLCRPAFPPFVQYPIFIDLPAGAGQAEAQAAVDQMKLNAVKTVYLAPGVGEPLLIEALAQAGVNLIGDEAPADQFRPQWVATIRADQGEALRLLWPKLIAGEGGANLSASINVMDINPELLSPGRQRLVNEVLQNLLAGYVDTGVDPQTGELK